MWRVPRNSLCKSVLGSVVFNAFKWLTVFCTTQDSKTKILKAGFPHVQKCHSMQNCKVCKDHDIHESFQAEQLYLQTRKLTVNERQNCVQMNKEFSVSQNTESKGRGVI